LSLINRIKINKTMKNLFKTGFAALAIAISVAACSGNNSTHVPDSTRVDTPINKNAPDAGGAEVNGAPGAVDSGMDNSGSGGTDSIKQGRKRKEFDRKK
jgi:predicted small lipoprotein YifL